MFRPLPLLLSVLLAGLLGACKDTPQGDPSIFDAFEARFEEQGGGVMVQRLAASGVYDFSVFRVHGIDACKAAYDPRMKEVSHQVVFGALFGADLIRQGYLAQDYNLSLWSKDLSKELWDGYCWQMVKNRDDYAQCPSAENQTFLIGLFSKSYYETEEHYDSAFDAALELIAVDYNGSEPAGTSCSS